MTLAAMWVHDGAVCAIADSAVTLYEPGRSGPTSVGQKREESSFRVDEAVLKLMPIGKVAVVAGAGRGSSVEAFAHHLRSFLQDRMPFHRAIHSAHRRALDTDLPGAEWDALVGTFNGDSPQILHCGTDDRGRVFEVRPQFGFIGSARDLLGPGLLDGLQKSNGSPSSITTSAQAFVYRELAQDAGLFDNGIGGPVFAGALHQDGFHWQPDTMIAFCTDELFENLRGPRSPAPDWMLDLVFVGVRDDVGFCFSTYLSRGKGHAVVRAFHNRLTESPFSWYQKWEPMLGRATRNPDRVIFLHRTRPGICILRDLHSGSPVFALGEGGRCALHPALVQFVDQGLRVAPGETVDVRWASALA